MYKRKSYQHWSIGTVYRDHKRNRDAILLRVSPYKNETGVYLDFKYTDSGPKAYIRQSAAKALSRFEATDKSVDISAISMPMDMSQDETFHMIVPDLKTPPKTNKKSKAKVSKNETVAIDWTNVIRVDFILRKRIY